MGRQRYRTVHRGIMGDLANRIRKRRRHLGRWARRNGITCLRIYDRDIPESPAIVDWYDGEAVVWALPRHRDESDSVAPAWREELSREVSEGLDLEPSKVHLKIRQRQQPGKGYGKVEQGRALRIVGEFGLKFEVNLSDYLDTGLFLDHRDLRRRVREMASGLRFLNLFAYTGSFTCYALAGGARASVTVDMSGTYLDWARRNFQLNGFTPGPSHRFELSETQTYLEEASRGGEAFDLIVCDPPTFSNSKRMRESSFAVERDHPSLLVSCLRLLAPGGTLIFSTNARKFRLAAGWLPSGFSMEDWTVATMPEDFKGSRIHQCWAIQRP